MLSGSSYDQPWRGLPPELRYNIFVYALSFPSRTVTIAEDKKNGVGFHPELFGPMSPYDRFRIPSACHPMRMTGASQSFNLPLLRVNKEAYEQGTNILYGQQVFVLNAACYVLEWFLDYVSARTRRKIRNIHLSTSASTYRVNRQHRHLLHTLLHKMTLKSLTVSVQGCYYPAFYTMPGRAVFDGYLPELRLLFKRKPKPKFDLARFRNSDSGILDPERSTSAYGDIGVTKDALYSVWEELSGDTTCNEINAWHHILLAGLTTACRPLEVRGSGVMSDDALKDRLSNLKENLQSEHPLLYPFRFQDIKKGSKRRLVVLRLGNKTAEEEYTRQVSKLGDERWRTDMLAEAQGVGFDDILGLTRVWLDMAWRSLVNIRERIDSKGSRHLN